MKIANKIALSFLLVSLIFSSIASITFYMMAKDNTQKSVYVILSEALASRSSHIKTYLAMLKASVGQLSRSPTLEDFLITANDKSPRLDKHFEAAMKRLKATKEANPSIAEFLIMDRTGRVAASSNEKSVGSDKSTDAIFLGGQNQKEIYVKSAYYSETYKEPLMAVSAPLFDGRTGVWTGVLAARVKLNDLNEIVGNRIGMGDTGETYLINKYGYMITPSRLKEDVVLKERVNTRNTRMARMHTGVEHLLSEKMMRRIFPDYRGVQVVGAHEHIPSMQWIVLAEIDVKEAHKSLADIRLTSLVILFVTPIIAWLMGFFVARLIVGPLEKLRRGAAVIGSGDLDHKTGIRTNDEVGQLSQAFDKMAGDLKHTTTSVDALNKEIASRKKVEALMEESEEKFRTLFESSREAIMILDRNGFINCNDETLKLFGIKNKEDFIRKHPSELSPSKQPDGKDSASEASAHIEKAFREGADFFEWDHRKADGPVFPAEVLLSRFSLHGRELLQATVRNVTERKRSEEAVKKAADEWANTFDAISDFIFLQDNDFTILRVNKAFAAALKSRPEDIVGKKCYEVLYRRNEPWPNCPFAKALSDNKVHTEEVDDANIGAPLLVTTSPMFDQKGELIGSVHIAKNITDIKNAREDLERKNEELKKLNQIKSDFISTVSHELRTPLSITKEGISLILDRVVGDVNDRQFDILSTSRNNIDRLARIINELLDISKIEAGRMELKMEPVDVAAIVKEVAATFGPKIKERGLELVTDLPAEGIEIYADSDKIVQVFTNLINNAVKFTDKGSIEVSVKETHGAVVCSVSDTGVGISPEDLPNVFEKFRQFSRVAGPGDRGTGLGLSIVKGLVEAHKGNIWVESLSGKGAKFIFRLPKYNTESLLREYVNSGIESAKKSGSKMSLISISVADFAEVERKTAAEGAHLVLKEVRDVIAGVLRREGDTVIKYTGEVMAFLPNCGREGAVGAQKRMREALNEYLKLKRQNLSVKLNFGCVTYPDDAEDGDGLIGKVRKLSA